jgi:O-antigen ligase
MHLLILLFVLAVAPFAFIIFARSLRNPVGIAVACYAFVLPFGSGFTLPIGLPSPFNTVSTLVGLWAIVASFVYLAGRDNWAPLHPSVPFWLALLALVIASDAWSLDHSATLRNANVLVSLVALFVVVSLVRADPNDVKRVEIAAIAGGASACCYGLWLLNTGGLTAPAGMEAPRFATAGGTGDTADPNITAASLLLPLVLALTYALRARTWRGRLLAFGAFGLIATGIVLTGSRGGAIAAIVGCIVVITNERGLRLLIPFAAVVAMIVVVAIAVAPGSLGGRFTQTSSTGRTDIWRVGLRACPQYCLRGSGWGTFPDVYLNTVITNVDLAGHGVRDFKAHNIALAMLIEMGIGGLVLGIAGIVLVFGTAVRIPRRRRGPPLAALVAVLAANMFLSNFNFKYFWFVLTYVVIVANMNTQSDDSDVKSQRSGAKAPAPATYAP